MYKTFKSGFVGNKNVLLITSDFGKRNLGKGVENHNGIDFGVPQGTHLFAPVSGRIVTKKVQKNGAGLYLTIRHWTDKGYIDILFMHLKSVEPYIHVGYDITEGTKMAETGGAQGDPNSGRSSGSHLHLEIRRNGTNAIDPKYWFLAKHTLIYKRTGKTIYNGDANRLNFSSTSVKSQFEYKYSSTNDITVKAETEYSAKEVVKGKQTSASIKDRLAPGIWQIAKLLIDSSVQKKQVLDSGISTQQGSLLNFFRKVCQEPLVEFSGDTFGNQYYWFVRRPPFDKKGFQRMIDLTSIELKPESIISTNLSWNSQGIYSWYQYIPYADLLGIKESNLLIPSVFFPEFASVWGSRPLAVESNYFNYSQSGRFNKDKSENKQNSNRIITNAIADFKYLIESNAYNAFTRRGTITIMGDRRIKRGTLVVHTSGEVFYVDSVTNNYDIGISGVIRTTTLNVSRGIYPGYIYGKEVNGKQYSYFDIIDFGDYDENNVTDENWQKVISKWKVNPDVFGFFMSKQQVFWESKNRIKYE